MHTDNLLQDRREAISNRQHSSFNYHKNFTVANERSKKREYLVRFDVTC
jgi:hypothetical protein